MSKLKYFISITFVLITIFFLFYLNNLQNPTLQLRIAAEKNICIVDYQNQLFVFGDTTSDKSQVLIRSLQDYFQKKSVLNITTTTSNKKTEGNGWYIQNLTPNILRNTWNDTTIFFLNNPTADEITQLKSKPISFSSDFWVLQNSQFIDFFPPPKKAILFLYDRQYNEKLQNFAQKNQIPLIAVKQTNGILLTKNLNNNWQLKTR